MSDEKYMGKSYDWPGATGLEGRLGLGLEDSLDVVIEFSERRESYRDYVCAALRSMSPEFSSESKAREAHTVAVKLLKLEANYFETKK